MVYDPAAQEEAGLIAIQNDRSAFLLTIGTGNDGTVMDYIGTVQNAQADFVREDPCAAYVTVTDDLGYLDDGWHYDTHGFVRLGTAFAEAMIELETECAHTE